MRRSGKLVRANVVLLDRDAATRRREALAAEEPLDLRLTEWSTGRAHTHPIMVVMRTPGDDFELAAGALFGKGLLRDKADIATIRFCADPDVDGEQQYNIVTLEHRIGVPFDPAQLSRADAAGSSCGVCGQASLDALALACPAPLPDGPFVSPDALYRMAEAFHAAQAGASRDAGLAAAALFDEAGRLLEIREDVDLHNAVDKLIGAQLLAGKLPLHDRIMLLSGRAGYEMMSRALSAGLPFVVTGGPPSSLALDLAQRFDMTLAGPAREQRCTIYTGAQRIALEPAERR